MRIVLSLGLAAVSLGVCTLALATNSTEALDELRQGYSLKQIGNCRDAVPHLLRSLELEPSARAALNLSDCEQRLGDLVAAQGHAAQGADLARQQNNSELSGVAAEQLAAVEKRLPRLTVKLDAGAPNGCAVTRDGVSLLPASIGAAVAVNPGAHVVTVSASGREERRFDVSVEEGGRAEITVSPAEIQSKLTIALDAAPSPKADVAPDSSPAPRNRAGGAYTLPLVVLGVGAAGLAIGLATGLEALAKHASLLANCSAQGACPATEGGDLDSFHTLRTVSTVAYGIGAAGVVAGGILWLVAPSRRPDPTATRVWLGPGWAGVRGSF